MLSAELETHFVWFKGVGIVNRSLRRPHLAGKRWCWNITDRVEHGRLPGPIRHIWYRTRLKSSFQCKITQYFNINLRIKFSSKPCSALQ